MSSIEDMIMTQEAAHIKGIELVRRINDKIRELPRPEGLDQYEPRDTDIVVTTFPKSGTTLTQQLTYQVVIATGGAGEKDPDGMTFDDICEVVPFVDFGPKHGFIDYESRPRVYKSHSIPRMFPKTTQKHLVVIRNPKSYPGSALDFLFDAWAGEEVTNKIVLEKVYHEFLAERILGIREGFGSSPEKDGKVLYFHQDEKKVDVDVDADADADVDVDVDSTDDKLKLPVGPWFLHAKQWIEAMRPNMLFLFYEDIVADMGTAAKRIANFMGRELDDVGVKQVIDRCDRSYMSTDAKFKCTLEHKALGFGENAWKAKPLSQSGFKQFRPTKEEEVQIGLRFKQEFGVDSYDQLKEIVYTKQREMGVNV